jgi:hypothetical protein
MPFLTKRSELQFFTQSIMISSNTLSLAAEMQRATRTINVLGSATNWTTVVATFMR